MERYPLFLIFALVPYFARTKRRKPPHSSLICSTEMLATQARKNSSLSWRIGVDAYGRPNRRNKAAFSNFWRGLKCAQPVSNQVWLFRAFVKKDDEIIWLQYPVFSKEQAPRDISREKQVFGFETESSLRKSKLYYFILSCFLYEVCYASL